MPNDTAPYCGSWLNSTRSGLSTSSANVFPWTTTSRMPPTCRSGEDSRTGRTRVRSDEHQMAVYRTAADILVQYAGASEKTALAAIGSVDDLPEEQAARVWKSVATWATSESCSPEERTRLVRRLTAFADGALARHRREDNRGGARRVLEELSGFPVTAPDHWLFDDNATGLEHRPEDATWEVAEERLEQKRRSALRTLRESGGIEAILSLVSEIRNTRVLGAVASRVLSTDEVHRAVGEALQAGGDSARSPMRWFIQGLLNGIDDVDADALTDVIRSSSFAKRNPDWLPCLLARLPLGPGASRADGLSGGELELYWEQFDSGRHMIPPERRDWLIAGLCSVVRPRAALWALRGEFEGTRTESLRLLIDTLPRSKEQSLDYWDEQSLDYREKKLVTAIRQRPDLSPADAAGIEFMFFDVLEADEMPALAKAVASDPSWFPGGTHAVHAQGGPCRGSARMDGAEGARTRPGTAPCLWTLQVVAKTPWYDIKRLRCETGPCLDHGNSVVRGGARPS